MKSINKLLRIFGALCVLLGFSACTDEAEYTPAEQLANAQVYFPTTLASQVNLKIDATSFEVELNRVKTDEAVTVGLNVTNESGLFTIPSSVNFAAGEKSTKIIISYDPQVLGFDNFKTISIAIGDESHTTPYGTANYTFKAGIPSPWKSLGKATFADAWTFAKSYQVELQQNELEPSIYRLVDPYTEALATENISTEGAQSPYLVFQILKKGDKLGKVDITKDGLVYFQSICTGFFNTANDYNKNVDIHHPSDFTKYMVEDAWLHSCVKLAKDDGTPAIVQLAPFYYMDGLGGWDYSQKDGVITIVFPGVVIKDYSAQVTYKGRFTNVEGDNFAVADITLGEDVESAKVAMIEGDDIDSAIAGILDGSIKTMEVTSSGTINVPGSYNGLCSLVAVTFGDGEAQDLGYASFEFSAGTDKWKSLGMATYTDDFIASAYENVETASYQVEVQENQDEKGVYRLVNPYGASFPYNEPGKWDASKNYYLVINAQDPNGVYLDLQNTGLNWGNGNFYVYSLAANYLAGGNSLEDIKEAGYCGTLANGVITFPVKSLLFGFVEENSEDMYYANTHGAFKIVLPGATAAKAVRATAFAKVGTVTKELGKLNRISARLMKYGLVTSKAQSLK